MAKSNRRRDDGRRAAAAAAKAAEMRQAQLAAERRRRTLVVSTSVVAVIAVVVTIFVIVTTHNSKQVAARALGSGSTANYGFIVGKASAPVTMIAYEDFQCPHCEEFESAAGATIAKDVADGSLRVEYRPVAFLSDYSTRALNAAVCVNKAGGSAAFKKFHDTLFQHQPAEGSSGLSNDELIAYADQAMGKTDPTVAACIKDGTFNDWARSATDAFSKATSNYPSGSATPTVLLNGEVASSADLLTAAAFQAAVDKAANAS